MKGIIIYEDYRGKKVVEAIKLGMVNYECMSDTSDGSWINNLSGIRKESTQAYCNEEDTYDFETGALIALMKMCKFDKSYKAIEEAFKYNSYDVKKSKELEEENENLKSDCNKYFKAVKNLVVKKIKLEEENDRLKEKNTELIEGNSALVAAREHLLNESMHRLRDKIDLKEKYVALKAENEKLKLDCEKLQHGYLDTDMIFCGGRQNGKQYKALVELFKKLPQDKIDAAYREAYNTTLPVWQKEVLKQMYDVCVDERPKPPTKREEMWDKIFALHKKDDVIIKVKREDINTFFHELENKIPEITWASGVKIFEAKGTIDDIYAGLKLRDVVYFRLSKETKLSYSGDPDIYQYKDLKHIDYLPPMRWDLFKKGRLVVKVAYNNFADFYNKCEEEIGRKPFDKYIGTFTVYYKNGIFHTRPYKDTIPYAKKSVDWEDVR